MIDEWMIDWLMNEWMNEWMNEYKINKVKWWNASKSKVKWIKYSIQKYEF